MAATSYAPEHKARAVQTFLSRGNRSVREVSRELGISHSTLFETFYRVMERNSWPYTAKEVKDIRLRHNMTQEYFAEVMGVTIDAVRKWEKKGGGIKTGPAIRMLQQIEAEGHIPTFLVMETHRA